LKAQSEGIGAEHEPWRDGPEVCHAPFTTWHAYRRTLGSSVLATQRSTPAAAPGTDPMYLVQ
jgi:hypothetical protein